MTDPIKAKIQELVPEVMNYDCGRHREIDLECRDCVWNDCSLAVVLRAIDVNSTAQDFKMSVSSNLLVMEAKGESVIWNLTKDSWDEQFPETQKFIGTLLGVEL